MADPKMRGRQGSDAGPAGNGKQFSRFRLYLDTRRKALLAALVLLVLIVSNYLVQRSYERLDRDIKSIYEDRLLPSIAPATEGFVETPCRSPRNG